MGPGTGHKRDQAFDDLMWREQKCSRPISPGTFKPQLEASIVELGESVSGDRWSRQIATHTLEPGPIIRGDACCGLQVETLDLGAETAHNEDVDIRGRAANANDVAATPLTSRDHSADRSLGHRDQDRRAFHEAPLSGGRFAIGESTFYRKAGLRQIGWHALRHTFASHLVMRGAAMKVVQELLGHATMEMTNRYSHLSPDVPRDAVKLLDGLGSTLKPGRQVGDNALFGS
jgi:hypothetical protein